MSQRFGKGLWDGLLSFEKMCSPGRTYDRISKVWLLKNLISNFSTTAEQPKNHMYSIGQMHCWRLWSDFLFGQGRVLLHKEANDEVVCLEFCSCTLLSMSCKYTSPFSKSVTHSEDLIFNISSKPNAQKTYANRPPPSSVGGFRNTLLTKPLLLRITLVWWLRILLMIHLI